MKRSAIGATGLNKDMALVTGAVERETLPGVGFPVRSLLRRWGGLIFETHTTDTHGLVARVCGSQHWRNYGVSV